MSQIETVQVVNTTKRIYNGVRPGEVREINKINLGAYKSFGFEVLGKEIPKQEAPVVDNSLTVKEIKEKLSVLGVEFDAKAKKDELLELLENSNTGKTGESDLTGTKDLEKLLNDNGIEFAEGDDLNQIAVDNGLL
ncbi:hypothetical protein GW846_03190 [Candidatus Gracilibacteria bacterium]|nr:hypothetical protein [Candidatus Gracilibacteria bacterium]